MVCMSSSRVLYDRDFGCGASPLCAVFRSVLRARAVSGLTKAMSPQKLIFLLFQKTFQVSAITGTEYNTLIFQTLTACCAAEAGQCHVPDVNAAFEHCCVQVCCTDTYIQEVFPNVCVDYSSLCGEGGVCRRHRWDNR